LGHGKDAQELAGMAQILSRRFYHQDTLTVAEKLLGCFLVRKIGNKIIRALIVETEAYIGEDDLACHASKGRTKRTEVMYGEPGHAYVYLIYGMYHLLNIVTEHKEFPAAVLIRAVIVDDVPKNKTNGPGKLTRLLQIDRTLNTWDITQGEKLWIEKGKLYSGETVVTTPRIGIDYAKHCARYPWRFLLSR
jgi:DNA-3-methyladenine glycosylase